MCRAVARNVSSHVTVDVDGDGDGWPDPADNCPAVSNPNHNDADFDGTGDACDRTPGYARNAFWWYFSLIVGFVIAFVAEYPWAIPVVLLLACLVQGIVALLIGRRIGEK